MENQFEKIVNIQLHISKNCTDQEKEILEKYWQIEDEEFTNSPRVIKKKYNISQSELTQIIQSHSFLTFYIHCKNCNSYEFYKATSQSNYKQIISTFNSYYNKKSKCDECLEIEKKKIEEEQHKKNQELLEKLIKAIENKAWENLSNFEKKVLKNSLEMNFQQLKSHYWNELGKSEYIKFIRALETLEYYHLLVLERDSRNRKIIDHNYLMPLKNNINSIIIKEDKPIIKKDNYPITNGLKLKLTINNEKHHPDSPLYAGTIKFKERIVLEPNIEYTFAQWERAFDNLYFTMIPTSEFERLPKQKLISKLPESIKDIVNEFLKNIGRNLNS